jgi:ABC-2 type transport system permease protein
VIKLLRGELVKVRTTRTALGFGVAAVLLVLAVVLVSILAGDPTTLTDKRGALNVGGALSIPLLLFGIVGATGEFRHHTLAPAVLIAPDRARLTLARVGAYALTALVVGIAMVAVALVLGVPLLGGQSGPDLAGADYTRMIAGGLLAAVLAVALGTGIGVLVRNQVAGVVGTLIWLFIVEPLTPLIYGKLRGYGILNAAGAVGGSVTHDTLSWGAAVGVLVAWAVVFLVAALAVDRRRDIE